MANWLADFLSDRFQRVCIENSISEFREVLSGFPQGGVLSGLVFALYENDLPDQMEHAKISLYADDAKIYSSIVSNRSIELMQKDITEWQDGVETGCLQSILIPQGASMSNITLSPRREHFFLLTLLKTPP